MEGNILALVGLGLALGMRHGIDWDHIAAITDITTSTVTAEEADLGGLNGAATTTVAARIRWAEGKAGFLLATLYALGHGFVVVVLGLLAIWVSAILPDWVDSVMERVVGVTLLVLGIWIFYSLWRYGSSFRLRSRWMLIFSWFTHAWSSLRSKMTGQPVGHSHDLTQYGPKTAFGVGMIHGIGAETGSQALLLAGAAGATSTLTGSIMLFAFVLGLLMSNSLIAALTAFGFVSSAAQRNIYVAIGIIAGIFSLVVGTFFILGQGSDLPDLQEVISGVFGAAPIGTP